MSENVHYLLVGEEANRGTSEKTTVGAIALNDPQFPNFDPDERPRGEARGEASVLGDTLEIRHSVKWDRSWSFPLFSEAGIVAGMYGTMLKHFTGFAGSNENASTGQWGHMMYPVVNPFATANLGTKALTFNSNMSEGAPTKDAAFFGGRVNSWGFKQDPAAQLQCNVGSFGQSRDASATALAAPTYAAENLRFSYSDMTMYQGTITRVGTGPDFTDFTFGGGPSIIKPDSVDLQIGNSYTDVLRMSGQTFADKTRLTGDGWFYDLTFKLDWEDPASGFSSVDDFNMWVNATSANNFFLHWNTGTQAGTGDNHQLYIDLPQATRKGGDFELSIKDDSMVTLKYRGKFNAVTQYLFGILLKNTASSL